MTLGLLTLAINLWAFQIELRNVAENARIIEAVMREVDRIRAAEGLPSNDEALRKWSRQLRRARRRDRIGSVLNPRQPGVPLLALRACRTKRDRAMQTLIFTALLIAQPAPDLRERERHPLAPTLPRLTADEEKKIDAVIDRLIQADTGKIRGDDAKKATDDFNRLGSEAIFNLIDGLNRTANLESSCPAVIIAKKIARVVAGTNDLELLQFAKENIGTGVTAKRHLNVISDLQQRILLRKAAVTAAKGPIGSMSIASLERSAARETGVKLKSVLFEAEKRPGPKAVDILIGGVKNSDAEIAALSQGLLAKNLQRQSGADLKTLLKHDRKEVRIGAAQAIGTKKLRYGPELIALLQDADDDVRQASRDALKRISGVDHGPERDASFTAREAAIERWREWWGKQK